MAEQRPIDELKSAVLEASAEAKGLVKELDEAEKLVGVKAVFAANSGLKGIAPKLVMAKKSIGDAKKGVHTFQQKFQAAHDAARKVEDAETEATIQQLLDEVKKADVGASSAIEDIGKHLDRAVTILASVSQQAAFTEVAARVNELAKKKFSGFIATFRRVRQLSEQVAGSLHSGGTTASAAEQQRATVGGTTS